MSSLTNLYIFQYVLSCMEIIAHGKLGSSLLSLLPNPHSRPLLIHSFFTQVSRSACYLKLFTGFILQVEKQKQTNESTCLPFPTRTSRSAHHFSYLLGSNLQRPPIAKHFMAAHVLSPTSKVWLLFLLASSSCITNQKPSLTLQSKVGLLISNYLLFT